LRATRVDGAKTAFPRPSYDVSTIGLKMMSTGLRCQPTIGRISDVNRAVSQRRAL
jgi:hypothetical protein